MLLIFIAYKGFVLYQMDVKFIIIIFNGFMHEEVYVKQPPAFENETFSHYVFKLS